MANDALRHTLTRVYLAAAKQLSTGTAANMDAVLADATADEMREELRLLQARYGEHVGQPPNFVVRADEIRDYMAQLDQLNEDELRNASRAWQVWLAIYIAHYRRPRALRDPRTRMRWPE